MNYLTRVEERIEEVSDLLDDACPQPKAHEIKHLRELLVPCEPTYRLPIGVTEYINNGRLECLRPTIISLIEFMVMYDLSACEKRSFIRGVITLLKTRETS